MSPQQELASSIEKSPTMRGLDERQLLALPSAKKMWEELLKEPVDWDRAARLEFDPPVEDFDVVLGP